MLCHAQVRRREQSLAVEPARILERGPAQRLAYSLANHQSLEEAQAPTEPAQAVERGRTLRRAYTLATYQRLEAEQVVVGHATIVCTA